MEPTQKGQHYNMEKAVCWVSSRVWDMRCTLQSLQAVRGLACVLCFWEGGELQQPG